MSSPVSCLFVYGTLRRESGHPMAQFLKDRARWLGLARAPGRLYDLGPYPGMLPAQGESEWVQGDLFELMDPEDVLPELDKYEGCIPDPPQPYLFRRVLTTVQLRDDQSLQAWVYYYALPVTEERRVPSGDFSRWFVF